MVAVEECVEMTGSSDESVGRHRWGEANLSVTAAWGANDFCNPWCLQPFLISPATLGVTTMVSHLLDMSLFPEMHTRGLGVT